MEEDKGKRVHKTDTIRPELEMPQLLISAEEMGGLMESVIIQLLP